LAEPKIFAKAFKNRYQPKGSKHGMSKLNESDVIFIKNYPRHYGYRRELAENLILTVQQLLI